MSVENFDFKVRSLSLSQAKPVAPQFDLDRITERRDLDDAENGALG